MYAPVSVPVTGRVKTVGTGPAYAFAYQYSLTDELTQITYPSGRRVSYVLDATDRVQTVQSVNSGTNYASLNYTTDPGNTLTVTMGNGVTEKPSFNDRLQPTGLQVTSSTGNLLTLGLFPCLNGQTSCSSDNNGNLRSQTITLPGLSVTQTYSYDSVSRLTNATETGGPGWKQTYGYVGANRYVSNHERLPPLTLETPQAGSWYSNSPVPNRINGWSYDGNGNVLQVGGMSRSFSYDAENRQVTANINSAIASYGYDGLGQRVSKTVGSVTTTYVYDAFGNLAAEYGPIDPNPCGTPTCYVTVDHLGSTRMLTDANGSSNVRRYDYQPFGADIPAGSGGRTTAMGYLAAADTLGEKFTGQFRDSESALDWFNVRHMSGAQGRFQSVDPANAGAAVGNPQTWNAYAYVGNNPLSYTDPSVLWFGSAIVAGSAVGGPYGAIIGGLIEIGAALAGIFGFGGGSGPPPLANFPFPNQFPDGTLFGSGNTDPFILA